MLNPRQLAIEDFSYDLPDERIAKYPLSNRNNSKLLVYKNGDIRESVFSHLPEEIPSGSLMIFNNTRVIQARLHFRKETGAQIEIFCLEPYSPRDYAQNFASSECCIWSCLVGNSKKWKEGSLMQIVQVDKREVRLCCERYVDSNVPIAAGSQLIRFYWDDKDVKFADLLDAIGVLPIPPYLSRETEEQDKETYQTVYAHEKGSVAAPTAGLHFTDKELASLRTKNVDLQEITLHVGAGTFKPVKSQLIDGHEMHQEFISVNKDIIERVIEQLKRREFLSDKSSPDDSTLIVAVGTTSVRTMESLYYIGCKITTNPDAQPDELIVGQWDPYEGGYGELSTIEALQNIVSYLEQRGETHLVTATRILIAPGFTFRLVQAMVTNFHMPQSTLLLLVSAFIDGSKKFDDQLNEEDNWHRIYEYALGHGFRFLSYGDSSLLFAPK